MAPGHNELSTSLTIRECVCDCCLFMTHPDWMEPVSDKSKKSTCTTQPRRKVREKERMCLFFFFGLVYQMGGKMRVKVRVCPHHLQSDCTCSSKTTYQVRNQQPLP